MGKKVVCRFEKVDARIVFVNVSDVVSFTNSQPVRVRSSLLTRDISAVRDTSRPVYPFFPPHMKQTKPPPPQPKKKQSLS